MNEKLGVSSAEELYIAWATARSSPRSLTEFLAPPAKEGDKSSSRPTSIREGRIESLVRKVTGKDAQGIRLNGIDDVLVRYTKCCNPLPGDEIIGFITRGRGITVHRRTCPRPSTPTPSGGWRSRGTRARRSTARCRSR